MQNQNVGIDGSGKATVKAQCSAEAFEFYPGAHTFTFQYALRPDEAPILAVGGANASGAPDPSKANQPNGDAAAAEVTGTVAARPWKFIAESARFKPWNTGHTVGFLVCTAADVTLVRPGLPGSPGWGGMLFRKIP